MIEHSGIVSERGARVTVKVTSTQRRALHELLTMQNKFTGNIQRMYEDFYPHTPADDLGLIIGAPSQELGEILIPRGLVSVPFPDETPISTFQFRGKLRDIQEGVAGKVISHLREHGGGILKADTGTGKTVVAIYIAQALGLKPLIIVPTSHLMEQWEERLLQFTDLRKDRIGRIVQSTCQSHRDVCIGMLHSLSKIGRYPEEVYNRFGLVIWDEVHRLSAPTFATTGMLFDCRVRLGLSATPRRKDGLENVFKFHIGEVIKTGLTQMWTPRIVSVVFDDKRCSHKGFLRGGELNLGGYLNRLVSIPERGRLVGNAIVQAYYKGRNILVLSDRIMLLNALEGYLVNSHIPQLHIGHFTGSRKNGLDRKIILATYGSAGLGADIPRLDTLVLATPRADVEQALGRILRTTTEKNPVVIDIVDTQSSIMVGWSKARRRMYESKGCKIHEVESDEGSEEEEIH